MRGETLPASSEGSEEGSTTRERGEEPAAAGGEIETTETDGPYAAATTWLFLTGNRLVVAAGFLLGLLALLVVAEWTLGVVDSTRPASLFYVFGGFIGGNFTLITIVISINQLVVSQQIGGPGELRDQIKATNDYREEVEESVDVPVAPVTPTEFLHLLLRSTAEAVESVREESKNVTDGEPMQRLLEATDEIYDHVGHVESLLAHPNVDVFQALTASLDTNYSEEMYRLRKLRSRHYQQYPEDVVECLDDIVVRLQQIDVARQYLKTIYIQDELSRLSRNLLYVGIPAVLVSALVLRMFASPRTAPLSSTQLIVYIPAAVTVAIAPLGVLFAYVVRLSTVAQRTVAITPFTTTTQERI